MKVITTTLPQRVLKNNLIYRGCIIVSLGIIYPPNAYDCKKKGTELCSYGNVINKLDKRIDSPALIAQVGSINMQLIVHIS